MADTETSVHELPTDGALEQQIEHLLARNTELEDRNAHLEAVVAERDAEIAGLTGRLSELEARIGALETGNGGPAETATMTADDGGDNRDNGTTATSSRKPWGKRVGIGAAAAIATAAGAFGISKMSNGESGERVASDEPATEREAGAGRQQGGNGQEQSNGQEQTGLDVLLGKDPANNDGELLGRTEDMGPGEVDGLLKEVAGARNKEIRQLTKGNNSENVTNGFDDPVEGTTDSEIKVSHLDTILGGKEQAVAYRLALQGKDLTNPAVQAEINGATMADWNDAVRYVSRFLADAQVSRERLNGSGTNSGVNRENDKFFTFGAFFDGDKAYALEGNGKEILSKGECHNLIQMQEGAPAPTGGGGAPEGGGISTPGGGGPEAPTPTPGGPETTPGGGGPTVQEGEHEPSDPAGDDGFGENPPVLPETPPVDGSPQAPPPGEVTPDPGGGTAPTLPEIPPGDSGDGTVTPPPTTDPEPQGPDAGGGGGSAGDF